MALLANSIIILLPVHLWLQILSSLYLFFSCCNCSLSCWCLCVFVCEMRLDRVVKRRELQLVCCLFLFDYGMSGEFCRRLHNEVIWHSFLIVQECMNKELCKNRTMKSNAVVNVFLPTNHADVNFKICHFQLNVLFISFKKVRFLLILFFISVFFR